MDARLLPELLLLETVCCTYTPSPPALTLHPLPGTSQSCGLAIEFDDPLTLIYPLPAPKDTLLLLNEKNEICVIQVQKDNVAQLCQK